MAAQTKENAVNANQANELALNAKGKCRTWKFTYERNA